jgi:hypothetical protein
MENKGRRSVTDRELRQLFSPLHMGGHRRLIGRELEQVWEEAQKSPTAQEIIQRYGLTSDDLPHLYQRFHDLITQ